MSSPNSSQTHESKQEKEPTHVSELPDSQAPEGDQADGCSFCLDVKTGCGKEFVNWEKCVAEAEKNQEDVAEKCADIIFNLKECLEATRDYYAHAWQAEEAYPK